jgi:sigma-B regulation protein RsbU (phosphoserine phosphatase)
MTTTSAQQHFLALEQLLAIELEEARMIQQAMVNGERIRRDHFEAAVLFRPAREVGGDFLDYFTLSDGALGIYVGDVVGKGLAAAMYAALAVGTLRGLNKSGTAPAEVLALLNQRLRMRVVPGRFCAVIYAVLDPATLVLRYANAGLPRPVHISSEGCHPAGEGGIPAGMFGDTQYDGNVLRLAPGDTVLFSTDGLFEAQGASGEQFGEARMLDLCAQHRRAAPEELLATILDAVDTHCGDSAQHDDVTALALRVK